MASWPCYVTSESMTSDLQASPLADGVQSAEGGQRGGIGMVPFIRVSSGSEDETPPSQKPRR
jgi:hypothetical protein